MRSLRFRTPLAAAAALVLVTAACGSDGATPAAGDSATTEASGDAPAGDMPTIVVTTNILGDVVGELVGDQAEVVTIMPVGADPHDFQASAQEINRVLEADALIVNGAAFEEGLLDVIESAEQDGVATYEAISTVATIEFGEGGHGHDEHGDEHSDEHHDDEKHDDEHGDEHGDEEHADEKHDDEHGDEEHADEKHDDEHGDEEHADEKHDDDEHDEHDHDGADPHFFTDPARMATAVDGIVDFLSGEVEGLDVDALTASAAAYVGQLDALDAEVAALADGISAENRVLVTNHEVFGYFADRYGFEVVGVVIPSGSTTASASAGELAELAEAISAEGVPAIFSDTSSSDDLIGTLADEVGDIAVVELFTESLGAADSGGATYLDMVRTNAERITTALS